jgi:hypothetical protein
MKMADESTKRAAEEYLAAKLSKEGQSYEDQQNREAAEKLGPAVWKRVAATVTGKIQDWNSTVGEQIFSVKETIMGDLRVLCAGRSQQLTIHFDSRKLLVAIKNTARLEHEKDLVLSVEGYSTGSGRDARLMHHKDPVNLDMMITGELRVLAGLSRRAN